ncbi:metabolite traffic protein EboE [Algoriphagus sp. D3-2-R+10]|uniref:metabolite traffic protein EboE n=1 Tax=Algoriphagus aurantiacus TaxID=3103948 RepID=UPI002B3969C1|nr:metabolite traffic protein EboE [Algoriphagus sp. D3-2-R+10]MEB2776559.1 metabolite traffic protein EboE [Algoriphagus sp. D3-2-R+10]
MEIKGFHLTYCSNIHPGESWEATFENLKKYIPEVKKRLNVEKPFGIGLRLSNEASLILEKADHLAEFQDWLKSENAYVFTLNGFPYGDFHRTTVKDQVHFPDWTTTDRHDYTIRSFHILSKLLPEGLDGGISTSPISYRHWFKSEAALNAGMEIATTHLLEVVAELVAIKKQTGKSLHLDIEPEPDGILENSDEMIWLFSDWLLPIGKPWLAEKLEISEDQAEKVLKEHIQVCYDVCHFAIVYEKPAETFAKFEKQGIKIGKIQISAALKVLIPAEPEARDLVKVKLLPFEESTYLHQVVAKKKEGGLKSYSDLPEALNLLNTTDDEEWRIHFHVPVFLSNYGALASTQDQISIVLNEILKNTSLTNHLEVETYTWEVLPENIRQSLGESISRELDWVIEKMK